MHMFYVLLPCGLPSKTHVRATEKLRLQLTTPEEHPKEATEGEDALKIQMEGIIECSVDEIQPSKMQAPLHDGGISTTLHSIMFPIFWVSCNCILQLQERYSFFQRRYDGVKVSGMIDFYFYIFTLTGKNGVEKL